MASGLTHWSNCSPVRWPEARAASRRLVFSLCAFLAICADPSLGQQKLHELALRQRVDHPRLRRPEFYHQQAWRRRDHAGA